ncbi:hypothetical protein ACJDT4_09595 [Clostridium neuense]|uniref:Condensation domain-containing protein n=1 Tax=Clostridium neuense TaxID=1728934 RepID=A0ABW8TG75_9CLOT
MENGRCKLSNNAEKMILPNRAASAIYYASNKRDPQTIRIMVVMKDIVDGDIFIHNVQKAMERYPYYHIAVAQNGDKYINIHNSRPIVVKHTDKPANLGSAEVNYHMIAWSYSEKNIYLDASHGLLDGISMLEVLKTVLFFYCSEKYDVDLSPDGIITTENKIEDEEWKEPFTDDLILPNDDIGDSYEAYQLPEVWKERATRISFLLPQEEFMNYVKEYHGTPGIVITTFFSEVISRLCDAQNLPIVTTMYVNSRPMLGKNKAGGCLVTSVDLPLTKDMKKLQLGKRAYEYRKMQKEKASKEQILKKVSKQVREYIDNDRIKSLQEKLDKLGKADSVFQVGTFSVSSTGRDPFGSVGKFIREIHNIVIPTTYLIEMNCVNDMFTIDFLQSFSEARYVDEFEKILKEEEIPYIRQKAEIYNTSSVIYDQIDESV